MGVNISMSELFRGVSITLRISKYWVDTEWTQCSQFYMEGMSGFLAWLNLADQ